MKLDNIILKETENSPAVDFNFSQNQFKLSGESFMEDVNDFYGEIFGSLKNHLSEMSGKDVLFIFDLSYFNSSSTRVIFNLLEALDQAAKNGNKVVIEWHFDDEDIGEEGEVLAEDLKHAEFKILEKT